MGTVEFLRFVVGDIADGIRARRLEIKFFTYFLLIAGAVWLIAGVIIPNAIHANRVDEAKRNLHSVQLALERFAVDDPKGCYPADLETLKTTGYLKEFPINPFSGKPMQGFDPGTVTMRGDFIYQKRIDSRGEISGYTLWLNY